MEGSHGVDSVENGHVFIFGWRSDYVFDHLGGGEAGGIAISPQPIAAVLSHTQWLIDRGNLAAAEDFDLIAGGTLLHWDGSR